jgi:hypothetical protein
MNNPEREMDRAAEAALEAAAIELRLEDARAQRERASALFNGWSATEADDDESLD